MGVEVGKKINGIFLCGLLSVSQVSMSWAGRTENYQNSGSETRLNSRASKPGKPFKKIGKPITYDAGFKCGVPQWSIADFNRDGVKDFVIGFGPTTVFTAKSNPVSPSIWISSSKGLVKDVTSQLLTGTGTEYTAASALLTSDLNRDGRPDIVISDHGIDTYKDGVPIGPWLGSTPKLLLSNGSSFMDASAQFNSISPSFLHTAAIGDLNGDGALDIYMGSITSHMPEKAPYLLINNGSGLFTWTQAQLPDFIKNPYSIQGTYPTQNVYIQESNQYTGSNIFDFDNDGDNDLFVLAADSSSYSYALRNDGLGNFNKLPPVRLPAGVYGSGRSGFISNPDGSIKYIRGPGSVSLDSRAVDVNGDGWMDILIIQVRNDSDNGVYYRGGKVQILINNQGNSFSDETLSRGNPGFEAFTNYDSYLGSLSFFDVNRDGYKDIVALRAMGGDSETHIFLNDGSGHFARASVPGIPTDGILVPISDDMEQPTRLALFKVQNRLVPWEGSTVGACNHTVQVYSKKK